MTLWTWLLSRLSAEHLLQPSASKPAVPKCHVPAAIHYYAFPYILSHPDGFWARLLTLFPLTAVRNGSHHCDGAPGGVEHSRLGGRSQPGHPAGELRGGHVAGGAALPGLPAYVREAAECQGDVAGDEDAVGQLASGAGSGSKGLPLRESGQRRRPVGKKAPGSRRPRALYVVWTQEFHLGKWK